MKQELTHYRADELFAALEKGRRFMAGGKHHIKVWTRTELLDGDYEYHFDFDVAACTGRGDMRLGCVEFMVPTLHLNGTGAADLLDDVTECASRLNAAMSKMHQSGPHARDYYVQGDNAFGEAVRQHEDRLARLRSVYDELQALADYICDAAPAGGL